MFIKLDQKDNFKITFFLMDRITTVSYVFISNQNQNLNEKKSALFVLQIFEKLFNFCNK